MSDPRESLLNRGQDWHSIEQIQLFQGRIAAEAAELYRDPLRVAKFLKDLLEISPPTFFVHQRRDSVETLLEEHNLLGFEERHPRLKVYVVSGGNLVIGQQNKRGEVNRRTRVVLSSHYDRISSYVSQGPHQDGTFIVQPLHNPALELGDPHVRIFRPLPDGTVIEYGTGRLELGKKSAVLFPDTQQNESIQVNDRVVFDYPPQIIKDDDTIYVDGGPLDGTAGVVSIVLAADLLHKSGFDMRKVGVALTENEEYNPKAEAFALRMAPLVKTYGDVLEKSGKDGVWLCVAYIGEGDIRNAYNQEYLPVKSVPKEDVYRSSLLIPTVSQGKRLHGDTGLYICVTDIVNPEIDRYGLPVVLVSGRDTPDIYAAGTDDWALVHAAAHTGSMRYLDFRLPVGKPPGLLESNNLLHQYPNRVDVRAVINAAVVAAFTVARTVN